jgi:hypothetical protein
LWGSQALNRGEIGPRIDVRLRTFGDGRSAERAVVKSDLGDINDTEVLSILHRRKNQPG